MQNHPARPLRASLNVRLSRMAGDSNLSKEGMIEDLRALAARNNFVVVAEHVDDGITGAIRDRPGFQNWIADAREGRAEVLLAWHVDRMTREGLQVAAMLLDVTEGKDSEGRRISQPVRLMDTTGLDSDRGESFRLEFVIKAEIARAERERMKARSLARAERIRQAERYGGGIVPFGYEVVDAPNGKGRILAPVAEEKAAIVKAAELVLDNWTPGAVARWLTEQGIAPRGARRRSTEKRKVHPEWHRSSVIRMLTSDTILGRLVSKGVVLRHEDGTPVVAWEPLIDLSTHRALVAKLGPKKESPMKGRGRLPSRLLVGVLVCASCGRRMFVARSKTQSPCYRCATRSQGRVCESPAFITCGPVEEIVVKEFLSGAGRLPMFERRVIVADDGELARVEDLHSATLAQLGSKATPELFARLQVLEAQRDELAARPQETRVELVDVGRTMADEWESRDTLGRRELISDAMTITAGKSKRGPQRDEAGRLLFDGSRITIVWRADGHEPAEV